MSVSEPTVEELRRESERSRAALSASVAELRVKLSGTTEDIKTLASPTNIRSEVKGYVRDTSEQMVQTLQQKARDNPLQAMAVGAGLAYSAWGLIRSIPTPLLLMGAGCWLASRSGKESVQRLSEDLSNKAGEVAEGVKEQTSALSDRAQELAKQAKAIVTGAAESAGESLRKIPDGAAATLAPMADMAEDGIQALTAAKDQVTDASRRASTAVAATVEKYPLAVAGLGLAIGAVIAAALPRSEAERRVAGPVGALAKEKIAEVAGGLFDRAENMVDQAIEQVSAKASEKGVSPDALTNKAGELTEGVRAVVDRAVETAFGSPGQPSAQTATQTPSQTWDSGTDRAEPAGQRQRVG